MTSGCKGTAALELRGVRRVFKQAGAEFVVLDGIDLVQHDEFGPCLFEDAADAAQLELGRVPASGGHS